MTARGLAILWMRPHHCSDCRKRGALGLCMHPSQVEAMADVLDAMVTAGQAKRVDGDRLGTGGSGSTVWYPA